MWQPQKKFNNSNEQSQLQVGEKFLAFFRFCLGTELHLKSAPVKNFEANDYKETKKKKKKYKNYRKNQKKK